MTSSQAVPARLKDSAKKLKLQLKNAIVNKERLDRPDLWFVPVGDIYTILNADAVSDLFRIRARHINQQNTHNRESLVQAVEKVVGRRSSNFTIEGTYRKSLATLIYCSDEDKLSSAIDALLNGQDPPIPIDDRLPLGEADAEEAFGDEGPVHQYLFCALILKKGVDLDVSNSYVRLPFIGEPQQLENGRGAAGVVYLVKCASRHWVDGHMSNDNAFDLARKEFHERGQSRKQMIDRFRRELSNLNELKSSRSPHKNIMIHIASLVTQSKASLFYRVADRDLNTFLTDSRLDRRPLDWTTKAGILTNATNLVSALSWLHAYRPRHAIYHFDIRPQNILIMTEEDEEVWKLADFDLAHSYEQHRSYSRSDQAELSSVPTQLTPGTYRAPEVFSGGRAGHKSDVWSMGCIISLIISYLDNGVASVNQFGELRERQARYLPGVTVDFFYDDVSEPGQSTRMYPEVLEWFRQLNENARTRETYEYNYVNWLTDYLPRKVFVAKENRVKASELYKEMDEKLCALNGTDHSPHSSTHLALPISRHPHLVLSRDSLRPGSPTTTSIYGTPLPSPGVPTPPNSSTASEPHLTPTQSIHSLARPSVSGASSYEDSYESNELGGSQEIQTEDTEYEEEDENKQKFPATCTKFCDAIRNRDMSGLAQSLQGPQSGILNEVCQACNKTPLRLALHCHEYDMLKKLLKTPEIEKEFGGDNELTPYMEACERQDIEAAILFHEHGALFDKSAYECMYDLSPNFKKQFKARVLGKTKDKRSRFSIF